MSQIRDPGPSATGRPSFVDGAGSGVSVVVPALNENGTILRLLEALRAQEQRPDEVLVVDGCSTDGTGERVRAYSGQHPDLKVRLIENPGGTIPAALNAGVRAARGEVVIRMDAHARPAPDYVRRALAALRAEGAEMVGGRWRIEPGRAGVLARAIAEAVGHPLGAGDARYRWQQPTRPGAADTVPYGCFHKSLWRGLGGFNEALLANEDYEFNYRVRAGGGRVHYDPQIVSHYPAAPALGALWRQYFRYGWWKMEMLRLHPRSVRWRQWGPLAALGALGAAALAGPLWGWAGVAALALLYAGLVGGVSLGLAWRRRQAGLLWALPLAFATLHFAWSLGGWSNLATGGRWPLRRPES